MKTVLAILTLLVASAAWVGLESRQPALVQPNPEAWGASTPPAMHQPRPAMARSEESKTWPASDKAKQFIKDIFLDSDTDMMVLSFIPSRREKELLTIQEADEVRRIVIACRERGVPFVPRGAGTGLSGGATAGDGGVVIERAERKGKKPSDHVPVTAFLDEAPDLKPWRPT